MAQIEETIFETTSNAQSANFQDIPTKAKNHLNLCTFLLFIVILIALAAAIVVPIVITKIKYHKSTAITATTTTTMSVCQITYSQSFTIGLVSSSQCLAWNLFISNLTCSSYSILRLYGSNDPLGIYISNSTVIMEVISALQTNSSYMGRSNGYNWTVDKCGGGFELSAMGSTCSCSSGYVIRPCIGNSNWGGVNSTTCNAPNQTMSIHIE